MLISEQTADVKKEEFLLKPEERLRREKQLNERELKILQRRAQQFMLIDMLNVTLRFKTLTLF